MSAHSEIEWTDHTFNPWHGCTKISPGCKNCYAEALDARDLHGRGRHWGDSPRWIAPESAWQELERWEKARSAVVLKGRDGVPPRPRVFCLSMGDVCEEHPALEEPRRRLVQEIELSLLFWLLLSKRPHLFPWKLWRVAPDHVALGASVEDQRTAEDRARALVEGCCARWRFLSVEPLLEAVSLPLGRSECAACSGSGEVVDPEQAPRTLRCRWCAGRGSHGIDWVIVGGESGPRARPVELGWIVDVVAQCREARVPVFVKQLGRRPFGVSGMLQLKSKKGKDPTEWPAELLSPDGSPIRELPEEWTRRYLPGGTP